MPARLVLRFSLSILLITSAVSPAMAVCVRYECRRTLDTAACWERVGPIAPMYAKGASCEEVYQCSWYYSPESGWGEVCSYDCEIEQCYDI